MHQIQLVYYPNQVVVANLTVIFSYRLKGAYEERPSRNSPKHLLGCLVGLFLSIPKALQ